MNPYPTLTDDDPQTLENALNFIARERTKDITDWNNLPNRFMAAGALSTAFKLITTTYDISTTGILTLTGSGFTPQMVILLVAVNNTSAWSIGYYDGTNNIQLASNYAANIGTVAIDNSCSANLTFAAGTQSKLNGATLTSSGATFTITKSGSPTGTAVVYGIFFR